MQIGLHAAAMYTLACVDSLRRPLQCGVFLHAIMRQYRSMLHCATSWCCTTLPHSVTRASQCGWFAEEGINRVHCGQRWRCFALSRLAQDHVQRVLHLDVHSYKVVVVCCCPSSTQPPCVAAAAAAAAHSRQPGRSLTGCTATLLCCCSC